MVKFTPKIRGALIERTAAGASLRDAAAAVGVRHETVKGWLARGRREDAGDYRAFADAIEAAREDVRARPEQMTDEEFRAQLERAVRAGSVTAMKLWADLYLEPGDDDDQGDEEPASPIVVLAERARRRGAAS